VPGSPLGLGSLSGHHQHAAQPIATANDAHDATFGDGNAVRRRPVHGWIVQNVVTTPIGGNFRDEFETMSYSNNDGSLTWAGDWIEVDAVAPGTCCGEVFVSHDITFQGAGSAAREADLSAFSQATLSFHVVLFAPSGSFVVEVSANGGASYTPLASITTLDAFSYDISSFISSNTRVRFRSENKLIGIDDVDISVSGTAPGTLVPAGAPIPGTPAVEVQQGQAAWGRPLAQSTTPLAPFLADAHPVLDADPL
jgi:hypothetical protein